jgi:hypothetical protein
MKYQEALKRHRGVLAVGRSVTKALTEEQMGHIQEIKGNRCE